MSIGGHKNEIPSLPPKDLLEPVLRQVKHDRTFQSFLRGNDTNLREVCKDYTEVEDYIKRLCTLSTMRDRFEMKKECESILSVCREKLEPALFPNVVAILTIVLLIGVMAFASAWNIPAWIMWAIILLNTAAITTVVVWNISHYLERQKDRQQIKFYYEFKLKCINMVLEEERQKAKVKKPAQSDSASDTAEAADKEKEAAK